MLSSISVNAVLEVSPMQKEYNFTLTLPLVDINGALELLDEAQANYPSMRLTRKPDHREKARFYLSFPFSGTRNDLHFLQWFTARNSKKWELFGPNYGVWGLS